MDYGQPTQITDSQDFFTEGAGNRNPNVNNFEADNNLNTDNWDVTPTRNPGALGGRVMTTADQGESADFLPLPSSEMPEMPSEVYHPTAESLTNLAPEASHAQKAPSRSEKVNQPEMPTNSTNQPPELGQVTSLEPEPTPVIEGAHPSAEKDTALALQFTRKQAMSGDKLSNEYVKKLDDRLKELDNTGDIAAFMTFLDQARKVYQGKADVKEAA